MNHFYTLSMEVICILRAVAESVFNFHLHVLEDIVRNN